MRKGIERRRAERINLGFPLKLVYRKKRFTAYCRDISGGGIGVSAKQLLKPQDRLKAIIPKGVLGSRSFNIICKVAWSQEIEDGKFRAGLCFEKIDDKKRFIELLCEKMLSVSLGQ